MDFESFRNHPPGDPALVDKIVSQLKSQGIFDQFRKECLSDVDTKPAYQNLRQRVDVSVAGFLAGQEWKPDLNKNQLRESLRKHVQSGGFLDIGVERIVDQVVNPKIGQVFLPQVKDVVYECLGIKEPSTTQGTGGILPFTVDTSVPPPNLRPPNIRPPNIRPPFPQINLKNINSVTSVTQPVITSITEPPPIVSPKDTDNSRNFTIDNDTEKKISAVLNSLEDSISSLDSHVSGITELASHSSLSLNVSKESNVLEDEDILESNEVNESLIKSEESNVDSISEAPVLQQSDTNTNISGFDSDSSGDLCDVLKSENDESTQNGIETPINDDFGNSDDEMSTSKVIIEAVKDELSSTISDYSKYDSDDCGTLYEEYSGSKSDSWLQKHKIKKEQGDGKKSERKKTEYQKKYSSEHKKEEQSNASIDYLESSPVKDETDNFEPKYKQEESMEKIFNQSILSDDEKVHKSSDDEKESKNYKKDSRPHDKSRLRDKDSRKDNQSKGHHSRDNHHHYRHSLKEKHVKELTQESSRDSKDSSSNTSNYIDKKTDGSKSRDKIKDDYKSNTRSFEDGEKYEEDCKERERKKSESSDARCRDSNRTRHHSDSKSKSRSDSDSRDRHHHHHHHQHSKEEKRDSKDKRSNNVKENSREGHQKEMLKDETSQSRDGKEFDVLSKRKEDRSRSKEDRSDHHRDRHDSSRNKEKQNNQDNIKIDKSYSESRKDEKKSSHRSHNHDREKNSLKLESGDNKRHSEEKHSEKHKKDERSRSKKTREHCKTSSRHKEDRRSADRDSSGSGEKSGTSGGVARTVEPSSQEEKKGQESVDDKNSNDSASDSTELCVNETSVEKIVISAGTASCNTELCVEETVDVIDKFISTFSAGNQEESRSISVIATGDFKDHPKNCTANLSSKEDVKNELLFDTCIDDNVKFHVQKANGSGSENTAQTVVSESAGLDLVRIASNQFGISVSSTNVEERHVNDESENTCTKGSYPNYASEAHKVSVTSSVVKSIDEVLKSNFLKLKNSVIAKMNQRKSSLNIFEGKKILVLRKSLRKMEQNRLKLKNVDDGFCYFKLIEIQEAKEIFKKFNCLLNNIESCYNRALSLEKIDFHVREFSSSFNEKGADLNKKLNLTTVGNKFSSVTRVPENNSFYNGTTPYDSTKSEIIQTFQRSNANKCTEKNKTDFQSSDYNSKNCSIEQNHPSTDTMKRTPVKLRISVRNPNDCKVIEINEILMPQLDVNTNSSFTDSTLMEKTSNSHNLLSSKETLVEEILLQKESSSASVGNASDRLVKEERLDTSERLKQKRGRSKKKKISQRSSVEQVANMKLMGIGVNDSINFDHEINVPEKPVCPIVGNDKSSINQSLDLKQMNPVLQKVATSAAVKLQLLGQAVSPKSPPNSASSSSCSYEPICMDDAAVPNDTAVTSCCILSRSEKSDYESITCDTDHKKKSRKQYLPSTEADSSLSYSINKNVDIISPNRLNNNLSDTSDFDEADECVLNENENYLTNPLIGGALKDLMMESGLVGGCNKVPVDNSKIIKLETGKQPKSSTKKRTAEQDQQENCNVTSTRIRGRLSSTAKQTQRYDNSDLYKPRLVFRQRKRKRSPEVPLKGSDVTAADSRYCSADAKPPSKRAR